MKLSLLSNYQTGKTQNRFYIFTLFTGIIFMIGCSSTPTFIKPDFEKTRIISVAVMPVTDKRVSVEDKELLLRNSANIETSLAEMLMDKNYDVLSADSIKNFMNGKSVDNLTPANLCNLLNVDAVLYSELFSYSDKFLIDHSIKMSCKLFDSKGDSLWLNDLNDSDKPFLSAVGSTLGWGFGISNNNNIPSNEKFPTILAGITAAELVYAAVDGLSNETSQSITRAFHSLPEKKGKNK